MSDLLTKLNKEQKEAVTHDQGPLLIVAGAGTGKTTILINRLAYLIIEKKNKTDEVLLLTFTEKAAGEMEERADKILPYGYTDLWINTFHGFCERILRDQALEIGLNASFKLLSATEQWMVMKKNLNRFNFDYYRPLGNPTEFISEILSHFSRLKDENISVTEYQKYVDETIIYDKEYHVIIIIMKDISQEEKIKAQKNKQSEAAIEIADKVVEKQMRVVQEIALLLGETAAETKIALTKLKETMEDE